MQVFIDLDIAAQEQKIEDIYNFEERLRVTVKNYDSQG